jgi:hypothetical protein
MRQGQQRSANGSNGVNVYNSAINVRSAVRRRGERNVISGNALDGVRLDGGTTTQLQHDLGELHRTQQLSVPQPSATATTGFAIAGSANNNIDRRLYIATAGTGLGNVISGNTDAGIQFNSGGTEWKPHRRQSDRHQLRSGPAALGNNFGIGLSFSDGQIIGGTSSDARNVISGNTHSGIQLNGITNVTIQGNFIGTDITGNADVGNAQHGIVDWGGNSGSHRSVARPTGAGNVVSAATTKTA